MVYVIRAREAVWLYGLILLLALRAQTAMCLTNLATPQQHLPIYHISRHETRGLRNIFRGTLFSSNQ